MTDQECIANIRKGGAIMQKTVEWFFHVHFKLVYQKIGSQKIDKDQAIDAYSDAVTAFVENIREEKFRGDSRCSTYFIRIFNNKCIDVIRKNTTNKVERSYVSLEDIKPDMIREETNMEEAPEIADFFERLNESCRDLLLDWSDGYNMDEIAARNGLKNAHTARSKRYNCFQQLIEILQTHNFYRGNAKLHDNGERIRTD
jgi:RNA polymerase sigma-70 factor (ECF subfamily)